MRVVGNKNVENIQKEEQTYSVDFGSITIGQDEYDKLTTDNDYARKWVIDNAYIDQIIKE